jgi:hypothetical protein
MRKIYLYLDINNKVVYADYVPSVINEAFVKKGVLRSYELSKKNLGLFTQYYRLRIHPMALKNVTYNG